MRIFVKVIPGSSKDEIIERGIVWKIKLKSQPEKGKANDSLFTVLAKEFNVSKSSIKIVRGIGSRLKTVEIKKAP
jgi:uncharacterized protein (TIGR00251 family)